MTEQILVDRTSIFDDIGARTIEFTGEVDGEEYNFAVQYSVLEALSGEAPHDDALSRFMHFIEAIKEAALSALSRDSDPAVIVIGEEDLDQ